MSSFPSQPASSSTSQWPQSLISQFPAPPTTSPQQQQSFAAPMIISLGEEYTDATLPASSSTSSGSSSAMRSYLHMDDEDEEEYGDYDESTDDETSGSDSDDDYTPTSPETSPSSDAHFHRRRRSQSMNNIFPSALWHAEHARLVRIQNAVVDSERAARNRELKLESEVARIKGDLAKLKQARAAAATAATAATTVIPLPQSAVSTSSTRPLHPAGPRGPRPRPNSALSTQSNGSSTAAAQNGPVYTQLASIPSARPASGMSAHDDQDVAGEEDEATTVLSHHLTQARSARAQERQRRRLEHERMRELNMLLTLGSEVRKWEERLAWSSMGASRATTSSDDIHISNDSSSVDTDTDPDPRGKRLSRSFSLPSSRANHHHGLMGATSGSRSGTSTPASPALPSLSLSPLWRVSAEMILRRRSLSERSRRTTNPHHQQQQQQQPMNGAKRMCVSTTEDACVPTTTSSPAQTPVPVSTPTPSSQPTTSSILPRPTRVLRGPRDRSTQIGVSSATTTTTTNSSGTRLMASTTTTALATDSETLTSSVVPELSTSAATSSLSVSITNGTSSGPISPSSGKRYSVPPPITIPSNAQFCTSTAVSSVSNTTEAAAAAGPLVAIVRAPRPVHPSACVAPPRSTTPIKPSALKWAYTADDLAREREMEEMAKAKEAQLAKMLSSSSSTLCSESESEDSKSGSDGSSAASSASSSSSSSSQGEGCEASQQRRGRARFSWRKSLPKDTNATNTSTPALPTAPVAVDA